MPPRRDAVISVGGDTQRDKHIAYRKEHGRKEWEKERGYRVQSKVENAMFRYKELIGRKLRTRNFKSQETEVRIGVKVLIWMTDLGMPVSEAII